MIWESWPWKKEIAKRAAALEKRKRQKRWVEASGPKFEMDMFYSAYAIRKLMEAQKLSDELESTSIKAYTHSPLQRKVDLMNWDRLDELYDLSSRHQVGLGVRDYCNQIIHSFILLPCFVAHHANLSGVFVASDRQKEQGLYFIAIDEVLNLLGRVAQDGVVHLELKRKCKDGPLEVVKKSSRLGTNQ